MTKNPAEIAAAAPLTAEEVRVMFPATRDDSGLTGSAITAGLRERGMLAVVPDSDNDPTRFHYWVTREGFLALVLTLAAREQWVMLAAVARNARVTLEGADARELYLAELAALKAPASK